MRQISHFNVHAIYHDIIIYMTVGKLFSIFECFLADVAKSTIHKGGGDGLILVSRVVL